MKGTNESHKWHFVQHSTLTGHVKNMCQQFSAEHKTQLIGQVIPFGCKTGTHRKQPLNTFQFILFGRHKFQTDDQSPSAHKWGNLQFSPWTNHTLTSQCNYLICLATKATYLPGLSQKEERAKRLGIRDVAKLGIGVVGSNSSQLARINPQPLYP